MNHPPATGRGDGRACAEGRVTARDTAREALRDELSGWPIGSGYYQTTVGVGEATEMADRLLASPALDAVLAERVAALAEDEKFVEQLTPNLHGGGETARHPQFARFRTRHMLRALAAALTERSQS